MWFSYNNDNNWHSIDCDRVREIIEQNNTGIKPFNLKQDKAFDGEEDLSKSNRDLELLDKKFSSQGKKKKKKKPKLGQNSANTAPNLKVQERTEKTGATPDQVGQREKSHKNRPRRRPADQKRPPKDQLKDTTPKANEQSANSENRAKEGKSNKRRNFTRNRGKGGQNKGNTNEGKE